MHGIIGLRRIMLTNYRQKDKEGTEFALQLPTIQSSYPVSIVATKEVPDL
jgi:hypothetical protein